jgi:hypothetical protein
MQTSLQVVHFFPVIYDNTSGELAFTPFSPEQCPLFKRRVHLVRRLETA